jgi:hypothetical protein
VYSRFEYSAGVKEAAVVQGSAILIISTSLNPEGYSNKGRRGSVYTASICFV